MAIDLSRFNPASADFRNNLHDYYEALRKQTPIRKVDAPFNSYWVFTQTLVKDVLSEKKRTVFLKPGKDRANQPRPFSVANQFGDGLFFMDPPRHTEVRAMMEEAFRAAILDADQRARQIAGELLDKLPREFDLVKAFANPVATRVFMDVMGIRGGNDDRRFDGPSVDTWVRQALHAHSPEAGEAAGFVGGTATMALRAYFLALAREPGIATSMGCPSIMAGMQQHTGCPASPRLMNAHESMNTAVQFALGGYLSTEFLITTGVRNLARSGQWNDLKADRTLLDSAVDEMLRYDAPFQVADRWVAEDTELGGMALQRGDRVALVYGSANRDEKVFADPNRFDIRRKIAKGDNFGFGGDHHYCIGAPLAREVAKAAITALLDRSGEPQVVEGPWLADPYFRSFDTLTMRLP